MNTGCKLIVKNKVKANMILHSYSGYLFEGRICDGIFLCADSNELIFVRVYELEDQINSSKVLYSFRSLDNLRVADKFMALFLLRTPFVSQAKHIKPDNTTMHQNSHHSQFF